MKVIIETEIVINDIHPSSGTPEELALEVEQELNDQTITFAGRLLRFHVKSVKKTD